MLASIQIKNFALIEQLELDFHTGMTVITGETGAGKSIVIDALGLALGERADAASIRFGAEKADISASFTIAADSLANQWLAQQELDDGNECILRRVIAKEGRSRCFINGRSATLSMLRELGDLLVDIHGQHAHQSLLKPLQQLLLLDELTDDTAPLQEVKSLAAEHRKIASQLHELQQDTSQRQERSELLAYQLRELEALSLTESSIQQLEQDHARASNMQQLTQSTQQAMNDIFDQEPGLFGQLLHFQEQFKTLSEKDPALTAAYELLLSANSNLEEVKSELRHYQDSLDMDPEQLNELDERLTALFDLARKHQVDMAELPTTEQQIRDELTQLEQASENTEELEQRLKQIEQEYRQAAEKLTKQRKQIAKQLSADVTKRMQSLGMDGGKLTIELQPHNENFSRHGNEQVAFLVTANPGQPLQPLAKVASGGELSRISLAIQVITAEKRVTPCLIFDEVDVGIGGQTADIVGRMLENISQHAQVICVTHQAQVAARGAHHLRAIKTRHKNATETAMASLESQLRIEEIARMVGGQDITDSTLQHAKELLAG
ncbi:DNA repair protein RecN [Pleionea mediterranea]|uniref:DNA repair protein RecN n=1 Tax=Pleionea mediterranea TaxID=523701 RepID=A0A316FY34_9GAMM|nr:DNA repair protein RecN [Pleionea mediterranea]PWK53674.1 DNA replication and repair protein RecN [Pleionea mediterranea]